MNDNELFIKAAKKQMETQYEDAILSGILDRNEIDQLLSGPMLNKIEENKKEIDKMKEFDPGVNFGNMKYSYKKNMTESELIEILNLFSGMLKSSHLSDYEREFLTDFKLWAIESLYTFKDYK